MASLPYELAPSFLAVHLRPYCDDYEKMLPFIIIHIHSSTLYLNMWHLSCNKIHCC